MLNENMINRALSLRNRLANNLQDDIIRLVELYMAEGKVNWIFNRKPIIVRVKFSYLLNLQHNGSITITRLVAKKLRDIGFDVDITPEAFTVSWEKLNE